jgi:predicted ester cyclase
MSATDIVKAALAAVEAGDFKKADSMLADDMVFAGPVPEPLGKHEFLGVQMAMHTAMPDWKFNGEDYMENGDVVTANLHITGIQTGELSLPMPGLPKIPPSGKKVSLPKEQTTFTVKNGKLSRLDAASTPGGGVMGILSQLGVKMPS